MTAPFILRRLKTDPAIAPDLPEKIETVRYCPLTREQAALYQTVLDANMAEIEAMGQGMERQHAASLAEKAAQRQLQMRLGQDGLCPSGNAALYGAAFAAIVALFAFEKRPAAGTKED